MAWIAAGAALVGALLSSQAQQASAGEAARGQALQSANANARQNFTPSAKGAQEALSTDKPEQQSRSVFSDPNIAIQGGLTLQHLLRAQEQERQQRDAAALAASQQQQPFVPFQTDTFNPRLAQVLGGQRG